MTTSLLMHRKGNALVPADRLAEQDLAALGDKPVLVDVRKPRSLQHHRLLFALLRKVAESTPTPLSENALLSWVKVKTGHVEYVPLAFGQFYEAPASIAFGSMEQEEFGKFFDKVVDLICAEVVPGLGKPELLAEIEEMLSQRAAA